MAAGTDPGESVIAFRRHVGALLGISSETLRGCGEREEVNAGGRPAELEPKSDTVRALRKKDAVLQHANDHLKIA